MGVSIGSKFGLVPRWFGLTNDNSYTVGGMFSPAWASLHIWSLLRSYVLRSLLRLTDVIKYNDR